MAIFQSTGVFGYLCSALRTGKLDEKGRPIYTENFLSGFAGWGWKIWKTVAGFFRLEIDELVVRRTMTVFELLIQKIRAIVGAQAITQGNGKIKGVELSEDGTTYLLTLEEDEISIVEHDFIRCQVFSGGQRFYHVEVASIEGGVIRVPASEFAGSSLPLPGDEVVQFGNSSHDPKYAGRHSAIYMHTDESGQPAIDVMFDIYSKNWAGCTKVRVGGDIPGSGGLKGFYCENGMIKGVNSTGNTMYCIYPDGSAMFGDGSAQFNTDRSGHIAGGAIEWEWSDAQKKYVCTMKGVVLTWANLDDEAKENLKGEPGRDGTDGSDGINGNDGVPGRPGADGKVLYTWIRYADTDAGGGISNNPTGKLYIGFAYNKETQVESNTPSDYMWSLIKGTDGADGTDGVPGAPGADGKTTYTWIAYSDNADGSDMYQVPNENTKYIGIAVNKDTKTEGTNPADYTWSRFKGTDGADGRPGEDANLLPWVDEWNNNRVYIDSLGEWMASPKMFCGTKNANGSLTGIAHGRNCIVIDGVKRTGIFALVDNEVVFELDPMTKKYVFKGRVEANEGAVGGFKIDDYGLYNDENSGASIYIKTANGAKTRTAALGNRIPASSGIDSASMFVSSGNSENRAVAISASGCNVKHGIFGGNANFAIDAYGGVLWNCKKGDHWCMPGVLCAAEIDGSTLALVNSWGNGLELSGARRKDDGSITITHNLGHNNYFVSAMAYGTTYDNAWHEMFTQYWDKRSNEFTLYFKTGGNDVATPKYFSFIIFGLPAGTT